MGGINWKAERSPALSASMVAGMSNPRSVPIDGDSGRAIASFRVVRWDSAARSCAGHRGDARSANVAGYERCRFRDYETMIALSAPVLKGDKAVVEMRIWRNPDRDDTSAGFSTWTELLTLSRSGDNRWRVVARRHVGIVVN